jgi:hypothetical protein
MNEAGKTAVLCAQQAEPDRRRQLQHPAGTTQGGYFRCSASGVRSRAQASP